MRVKHGIVLAFSLILTLAAARGFKAKGAEEQQKPPGKTVWMGVYTNDQADRGKELYTQNCSPCHGDDLSGKFGNPLAGPEFMDKWREDTAESLFHFVKESMPPARNRGTPRVPLADQIYLDVMAYVFQSNSFPAGELEVKASNVADIQIEGRFGPRPLPNGALARVVGCLTSRGLNWSITSAAEPIRTRVSDLASTDEIHAAEAQPLGKLEFRLSNLGYVGDSFQPNSHIGHKMLVKGTLVRQPGAERIDTTSVTMISPTCQP